MAVAFVDNVLCLCGVLSVSCLGWALGAVLYENAHIQHDCEQAAAADDDDNVEADIRVMLSRLLVVGTDKNIA